MKKLLVIAMALTGLTVQANERAESFYRADSNKISVTGGVNFTKIEAERDAGSTTSKSTSSSTAYVLNAEYGLNDDMAIGTTLAQNNSDGESGLGGYTFFLKGQVEKFFYQVWANISPGEQADDNFYDGGNSISLMAGYEINKNFGAFLVYTPSYDYEYKDSDSDLTNGSSASYSVYYERVISDMKTVLVGSYFTNVANEEDGVKNGKDSQFAVLSGYLVKDLGMFEFIPSFTYTNYLGEDDDLTMTMTTLGFNLRKSF
ncbi:MAG: hypothetical protein ACJAS4_002369 [Bacteriovoracaceae bacterium]|jgi:hypothetical protein